MLDRSDSETFRKRPEAVRSLHPTHSVAAIGKEHRAGCRTRDSCCTMRPWHTIFSPGQLERKNPLLGVDLRVNTTYHGLEKQWQAPGHLQPEPVKAKILVDGTWRVIETRIHQYGIERDYLKTLPLLREAGIINEGFVGEAYSYLVKTRPMLELVGKKLKENPRYLYRKTA